MIPVPFILAIAVPTALAGGMALVRAKTSRKTDPVWDPELREVFDKLVRSPLPNPSHVKKLASQLKKQGHGEAAKRLLKRLELQKVPASIQERRREAVRQALRSTDKEKVRELAFTFEQEGAFSTAKLLEQYAAGLT